MLPFFEAISKSLFYGALRMAGSVLPFVIEYDR